MGLNRQEKADMIKEISEIIAGTEGLVIAEYRGPVSYTHLTLPTTPYV